jgi:hypothetical protein
VFCACALLVVVLLTAFAANLLAVFPRRAKSPSLTPNPLISAGDFAASNPMALRRGLPLAPRAERGYGSPPSSPLSTLALPRAVAGVRLSGTRVEVGPSVTRAALRSGVHNGLSPSLSRARVRRDSRSRWASTQNQGASVSNAPAVNTC